MRARLHPKLDIRFTGSFEQAAYDRFGRIAGREDAPIRLSFERDAAALEPGDSVARLEPTEDAPQGFGAARIIADKLRWLVTGVGDITATTT